MPYFNPRTLAGATLKTDYNIIYNFQFQSTHPCGCDSACSSPAVSTGRISIHAPLRVRPHKKRKEKKPGANFNPRTLAGATLWAVRDAWADVEFQSTHPCGCDLQTALFSWAEIGISIHAPLRVRHGVKNMRRTRIVISIHAPLRVRRLILIIAPYIAAFQSTHPYGCDMINSPSISKLLNFNPRTLTGATYSSKSFTSYTFISIHAPLRVRLSASPPPSPPADISIHAPLRVRH